jgi:hypothetical protein
MPNTACPGAVLGFIAKFGPFLRFSHASYGRYKQKQRLSLIRGYLDRLGQISGLVKKAGFDP